MSAALSTALRQRGVVMAPDGGAFDVLLLVVAEFVKSEDVAAVGSAAKPSLIVLTKADLAGHGPGGPTEVARRRAAAIEGLTGIPTVPMVGLLAALDAAAGLDDELVAALRAFTETPPNLSGVDAFVDDPHPVSRDVRVRLLDRLDRFGIAHAVVALAGGVASRDVPQRLRRLGNADEVMAVLDGAVAQARYRRVCHALIEIRTLAVQLESSELSALLATDESVFGAMSAAVAVVEADGLVVDRGDSASAHLDRAVRWRRYGRGPVNALHRACSADIVRGSLRLLAAAGESSP